MRILYRMATDDDIDAMAEFWSNNSGWDVIDRTEWERRFVKTPFGSAAVAIGIDEETKKIIGQFVFIPVDIMVKGKEVKAYRPFAPILQQSLQNKFGIASLLTGQHPLLKMYRKVWDKLTETGVSLIYIIPDPRWSRILQSFPFIMTHKFPLWSRSLTLPLQFTIPSNITVSKISPSDPEIDVLWQQASAVYPCVVVRNSKSLPWKASHGNYQVYAIKNNQQIAGFFIFIYKQKNNQWLICDMIVKDTPDMLCTTLKAACNIIQQENNNPDNKSDNTGKIAILATPAIEEVAETLGFQKDNYHFTLAVHVLNKENIDKKNITPINWYVSAND